MENEENIVRYTLTELLQKKADGKSRTDWAYVDSLTEEELEASIDWDEEGAYTWGVPYAFRFPAVTWDVPVCLDRAIIDWFTARHDDPRSRIRFVLRDVVDARTATLTEDQPRPRRKAS